MRIDPELNKTLRFLFFNLCRAGCEADVQYRFKLLKDCIQLTKLTQTAKNKLISKIEGMLQLLCVCYRSSAGQSTHITTSLIESINYQKIKRRLTRRSNLFQLFLYISGANVFLENQVILHVRANNKNSREAGCKGLVQSVMKQYYIELQNSEYLEVIPGNNKFDVCTPTGYVCQSFKSEQILNRDFTCKCNVYQQSGIVCAHQIKILQYLHNQQSDFKNEPHSKLTFYYFRQLHLISDKYSIRRMEQRLSKVFKLPQIQFTNPNRPKLFNVSEQNQNVENTEGVPSTCNNSEFLEQSDYNSQLDKSDFEEPEIQSTDDDQLNIKLQNQIIENVKTSNYKTNELINISKYLDSKGFIKTFKSGNQNHATEGGFKRLKPMRELVREGKKKESKKKSE
ncbi:Conserved_hypothetical protein [Hexamita inflata]|uniref:SWIM-type domain-containing protein n=1 Tax=Hexamita inflata TaxID=28002 RepID=A0AA86QJE2_9EUKA|nr:Conserved hypothetical protein [Hexamita inflata]